MVVMGLLGSLILLRLVVVVVVAGQGFAVGVSLTHVKHTPGDKYSK